MNNFNKIFGSLLLTVIIVLGINKASDIIYKVNVPTTESYKVEVKDNSQTNEKKEPVSSDIKAILALGSADQGKKIFTKCAACHSINKGGGNKIGPALYSVLGRKAGSVNDYKYSKGMASFEKIWGFEEMNAFLIKPAAYIKGTKMAFGGLKKEEDRASLILYMNQQTDNPLQIP
jgi:cytochrome c